MGFKMINGLIFGAGIGLLTMAILGLVNGHAPVLYSMGMTLVTIEAVRLFMGMRRSS